MRKTGAFLLSFISLIFFGGWLQAQTSITNPDSVCVSSTELYRVDSVLGSSYTWQVMAGGGGVLDGQTTAHISVLWNSLPGIDSIEVIETNEFGCDGNPNYLVVHKIAEPTIALNFTDTTCCRGSSLKFVSNYSGIAPYTFSWFKDDVLMPGETGDTLYIASVDETVDIGAYKVVIETPCSNDTSIAANLFVTTPPEIYEQPDTQSVCLNDSVALSVLATGSRPFAYQWQRNGVDVVNSATISGANDSLLIMNPITYADTGLYRCYMINSCDSVMSATAYIHINIAPDFTVQPDSVSTCLGADALISFVPYGDSLSFQWYKNGVLLTDSTDTLLRFSPVSYTDTALYYCIATNPCGTNTSQSAYLNINIVPAIVNQPDSLSLCVGNDAEFVVEATGDSLFYQWYKDGLLLPGETNDTLNFTNITLAHEGDYTVKVTNTCAEVTSANANLNINIAPVLVLESDSVSTCVGEDELFFVNITGDSLYYQWRKNGVDLVGETNDTIWFNNLQYSDTADYECYVWNTCGNLTSQNMYLNINIPPVITDQPDSISSCVGNNVQFDVIATGDSLNYQWYKDGILLPGQTNTSLSMLSIDLVNEGDYTVEVFNTCGTVTSDNANLNINIAPALTLESDSISTCVGQNELFFVNISGDSLYYQWRKNGVDLVGETNDTLTFTNIQYSDTADYECYVWNTCGNLTSQNMYLNINIPPVITDQPDSLSSCEGDNIQFDVVATGDSLNYQWYKNGVLIAGQTNASLSLSNISLADEGDYTVEVFNTCGTETSDNANLNINIAPALFTQTDSISTCVGQNELFSVTVTGDSLYYQWRKNGADIPGETTNTLSFAPVQYSDTADYECYVWNTCGNLTSQNMYLNINIPPAITDQPDSISSCVGANVQFDVVATGDSLFYQWYKNGVLIAGETSATLSFTAISLADEGDYTVEVTNTCGTETSDNANLNINIAPAITAQTDSISTCVGQNELFSVTATGDSLFYQWRKNGVDIIGETTNTLSFAPVQYSDTADYECYVWNTCGNLTSQNMYLNINIPPAITNQPDSISSCVGSNVQFDVVATGDSLYYQWYKNGVLIAGETSATLSFTNISLADEGDYTVEVSNTCGTETSDNANLNINIAPVIVSQSNSISAGEGEDIFFYVLVTGDSLNYQWAKDGVDLVGETNDTLFLNNITYNDTATYKCHIWNTCGSIFGNDMLLNINIPPNIIDQPDSLSLCIGDDAIFEVSVTGDSLHYQWQKNGVDIPGEIDTILTINNIDLGDEGNYVLYIYNNNGFVYSQIANLNINIAPALVLESDSISTCVGQDELFFVNVSGDSLYYQWRKNGVDIVGQDNDTIWFNNLQYSDTADYECYVWNTCGNLTSQNMYLNINIPPVITLQPDSISSCVGSDVQFSVLATGDSLYYQWYKDGGLLAGETATNLSLSNINLVDEGDYTMVVSNTCGTETTVNANLNINIVPGIVAQTDSISTCVGQNEFFSVTISGDSLNYQWRKNGADLIGETSNTLSFAPVQYSDTANYECYVWNTCGNLTSQNMNLNINIPPVIIDQPDSISACMGNNVQFDVVATGDSLYYQWYKNGLLMSGKTNPTLSFSNINLSNEGNYTVEIYNTCGSVTSINAHLNINIAPNLIFETDSISTCVGNNVTFYVNVTGDSLNYQWRKNGADIAGATSNTITFNPVQYSDTANYDCYVWNTCGNLTSQNMNLNINIPPVIIDQPDEVSTCLGEAYTMSITATGDSLNYQWYLNNIAIAGATQNSYLIDPIQFSDTGHYVCRVYNTCGEEFSLSTLLNVNIAPVITNQPDSVSTCLGEAVSFEVQATGDSLFYQWYFRGIPMPGATNPVHTVPNVAYSDTGSYVVRIVNTCGQQISQNADLNVNIAPTIAVQPLSLLTCIGDSTAFTVTAGGDSLYYQWSHDGVDIPGATASVFSIDPISNTDIGVYKVLITNTCGTILSDTAHLYANLSPDVIEHPDDVSACYGDNISFTTGITAGGSALPNFQWQFNGVDIPGETSHILNLSSINYADTGDYRCFLWNNCDAIYTNTANLNINIAPQILKQPEPVSTCLGEDVKIWVEMYGDSLNYQWYKNGFLLPGATDSMIHYPAVAYVDTATYLCEISNNCGLVLTQSVLLNINIAPTIITQPVNQDACETETRVLSVVATGDSLNYQWVQNGVDVPGATDPNYIMDPIQFSDAGDYYCRIWNNCGLEVTNTVYVYVNIVPFITLQPLSLSTCDGDAVVLNVAANGDFLSYQWQLEGLDIPGATGTSYLIDPITTATTGNYTCVISNYCGLAITNQAKISINEIPVIVDQPDSLALCEGYDATINVVSDGDSLFYQWRKNGIDIPGANEAELSFTPALLTDKANYTCYIWNTCGTDLTENAYLDVNEAPAITAQPIPRSICENDSVSLWISTTGDNLSYQWKRNGVTVEDATDTIITFNPVSLGDTGYYECVVSSLYCGELYSDTARLNVIPTLILSAQTTNISCYGAENGAIDISVANGDEPYTFLWSNGETSEDIANLAPGAYTVEIADANICQIQKTIEIGEPDSLRFGLDTAFWSMAKSFGGGENDILRDMVTDKDGNIYITGSFRSNVNFGGTTLTSFGDNDIFVAKYDSIGTLLWADHAGGTLDDESRGIGVDTVGNVYVTGYVKELAFFGGNQEDTIWTAGDYDVFIASWAADGTYRWLNSGGGFFDDYSNGIYTDQIGNSYITGSFQGVAHFNHLTMVSAGGDDIFTAKYNSSGNLQWVKRAGGTSEDFGLGITVDISQSTIVTGRFQGSAEFEGRTINSAGNNDVFLAKYDNLSELEWVTRAGGVQDDRGSALAVDYSGNIFLAGSFEGTATFNARTIKSAGAKDAYAARYDRYGNLKWIRTGGGTQNDIAHAIDVDVLNNIYVAGTFRNTATFSGIQLESQGSSDVFVTRYSNNGRAIWARSGGSVQADSSCAIALTPEDDVLTGGSFRTNGNFGNHSILSNGQQDIFFAKIKDTTYARPPVIQFVDCFGGDEGFIDISMAGGTLPYTYYWSTGDTVPDLWNIPEGTYWLFVKDANECTFDTSMVIEYLYPLPEPPLAASADRDYFCSTDPGTITLTAEGGSGDVMRWLEGSCDGVELGTGFSLTLPSPEVTTTYYVRWENSCDTSECLSVTVHVFETSAAPEQIIVDQNDYCTGTVDYINLEAIGGFGEILKWYKDGCGTTQIGTGTPLSYLAPQDTTVLYARWESSCGNSACDSIVIVVNPGAAAVDTAYVDTTGFCYSYTGTITLTAEGGSGDQIYWREGSCDGTLIGLDPVVTIDAPNAPTTYYVYWENSCGLSECDSVSVAVDPMPVVMDSLSVDFNHYCIGSVDSITMEAHGGLGDQVVWTTGYCGSPNVVGTGNPLKLLAPIVPQTTYYAYWENDCGMSICKGITIYTHPGPSVSFTGLDPLLCIDGSPITLTGNHAPEGSFTGIGITDLGNGTALFDPAAAGIGGPYDITYTYSDAGGCTSMETQTTSVNDLPFVNFTGLGDEYCANEAAVTLTGNFAPAGTFSGDGITDNGDGTATFDPALAGAGGPYDITYTYMDPATLCDNSKTKQVVVNGLSTVWFTFMEDEYCVDANPVNLTGSMSPEGYFEGPGIINTGLGKAQFIPALAGIGGPYEIKYIYIDPVSGCISDSSRYTTINALPEVSFSGLEPEYCVSAVPSLLTGNYLGYGSFSGPGITDYGNGSAAFDPAAAGVGGPYNITYTYQDANGCVNDTTMTTIVYALPELSFTGLDSAYCIEAANDTLYGNMAPLGSFSGPGILDLADGRAVFNPSAAGIGGPYAINYTFTDGNSCMNTISHLTKVVDMPIASFSGLESTYCLNDLPDTLSGNHEPEGSFSGLGIIDLGNGTAIFDPAIAGVGGPIDITYTFANTYGCSTDSVMQTTVNDIPSVNFSGLETSYCLNAGNDTLTGNHAPEGMFSGPGITDLGDGTAIFDPIAAGIGAPYFIVYTYSDVNGCTNDTTMLTSVLALPEVSFTGIDTLICVNADSVLLTGNHSPFGTFEGDGINDLGNGTAWFNPAAAGVGTHSISYIYQDIFSCANSSVLDVVVWPTPTAPISFTSDTSDFCAGTVSEVELTIGGGSGDVVSWFYGACGDSLIATTTDTTLIITPPADTAWYYARWENDCGVSACDSLQLIVNPQPIMPEELLADTNYFCAGTVDSVLLTANGGYGTELNWYTGSCGGDLIGSGTSLKIESPSEPTLYYARWENICDVTACDSIEIMVFPEAIVPDSLSVDENNFCANSIDDLTLTAHGGNGQDLTWYTGSCGGDSIGSGNPLTIAAPIATTWYYASYSNACNISLCDSIQVNVRPVPVVPDSVYADIQEFCDGTVDTIALIAEGGFGDYVLWFEGSCGGPVMGMGNPLEIDAPRTTTTYFARYENDCGETECIETTVIVNPQPVAPIEVTVDSNNYCPGYPYALRLDAIGGSGDQLNWYKDSCGGEFLGSYNPIYVESPDTTTVYYATWENVCGEAACTSIEVLVNIPLKPDSIMADTTIICGNLVDEVQLEAFGGRGDSLRWFSGSCGGSFVGTGNPFMAPVPDTTTTYYAYWENECGTSPCDSIKIHVLPLPTMPDSLTVDTNNFCPAVLDSIMFVAHGGHGDTIAFLGETVRWFEGNCSGNEVGTGDTLWLTDVPETTTWFFAHWENSCGASACDSIEIIVNNTIPVDSLAVDSNYFCPGTLEDITLTAFGGYGDTLKWYKDSSDGAFIGNGSILSIPAPDTTTIYFAQWQNVCNASQYDSITVYVNIPIQPEVLLSDLNDYCSDYNDSIVLTAEGGHGDTLRWYMNHAGGSYMGIGNDLKIEAPIESTWIYARYENYCGISAYDSLLINVIPAPEVTAGSSDSICEGSYFDLTMATAKNYDSVRWISTNGKGSFNDANMVNARWTPDASDITESDTSWLKLMVYGNSPCGMYEDSLQIIVHPLPEISYTPEYLDICQDSTIFIQAFGAYDYSWFPETGLDTISGDSVYATLGATTSYRITGISDKGCVDSAFLTVPVYPTPYVNLGPDIYNFGCDPVELDAGFSEGNYYYQWQDGDPRRYLTVTESGTYSVKAWNEGCEVSDSIKVQLCDGNFEVPNAFTPNRDGKNDVFRVRVSDESVRFSILIYNRAGSLVYKSDDAEQGWDGTNLNGKECPVGVYIWILTLQGGGELAPGTEKSYNGHVTIVR